MKAAPRRPQIAVVAAEPSGDLLGAGLLRELKSALPDAEFIGVGGDAMAREGCELLYRMERIGVIGVDDLLARLVDILRIRRALRLRFSRRRPDVFVGIDAPDFNLGLERSLRKQGVACVHYVSPTVWAWRGYRMRKIRRAVDRMLTLFPFEARYYESRGVKVTCVGHPMADEIEPTPDTRPARRALNLDAAQPLIALLPGSRRGEVRQLTPPLVQAARLILSDYPNARFVTPLANPAAAAEFERAAGDLADLPLTVLNGRAREAMQAADLSVLACGTAALEAALLGRAHIVVYKVRLLTQWLLLPLVRARYYSMSNWLLPSPLVPELMQQHANAQNIRREVKRMFDNPKLIGELQTRFAEIHRQLKKNASRRASEAVLSCMQSHSSA